MYRLNYKNISIGLAIASVICLILGVIFVFQIDVKAYKEGSSTIEINDEKTYALTNIKNINIAAKVSNVEFIPVDSKEVKVHIYGKIAKKYSEKYKPAMEFSGDTLTVKEDRHSDINFGINFDIGELFHEDKLKIDVYLPKNYRDKLAVSSFSGNVSLCPVSPSDLNVSSFSGNIYSKEINTKDVKLSTSSGVIETKRVNAEKLSISSFSGNINTTSTNCNKVDVSTSSGVIKLEDLTSEAVELSSFSGNIQVDKSTTSKMSISTSSGCIEAKKISGGLNAQTFSGIINAAFIKLDEDTNLSTSSGNIKVSIPENNEFSFRADSSSGLVNCDFPVAIDPAESEHQIRGNVGNGGTDVKLSSFSGVIEIKKSREVN